jgi:hypothetical protein
MQIAVQHGDLARLCQQTASDIGTPRKDRQFRLVREQRPEPVSLRSEAIRSSTFARCMQSTDTAGEYPGGTVIATG